MPQKRTATIPWKEERFLPVETRRDKRTSQTGCFWSQKRAVRHQNEQSCFQQREVSDVSELRHLKKTNDNGIRWRKRREEISEETSAVRQPIPEPMAKEPRKTTKKFRRETNIEFRSNLSFKALATYFSIELKAKRSSRQTENNETQSNLAKTTHTASLRTLSPKIMA